MRQVIIDHGGSRMIVALSLFDALCYDGPGRLARRGAAIRNGLPVSPSIRISLISIPPAWRGGRS